MVIVSSLLLLLTACADASTEDAIIHQVTDPAATHRSHSPLSEERQFRTFMRRYGKEYRSQEEYLHRLGVFVSNLAVAAEHQALDPGARHGVTPFSDLTPEEFERTYTGLAAVGGVTGENKVQEMLGVEGLPEEFDWREKGAVTEVQNQGVCESGWAFSTAGAVEGANFLATGKLVNLSKQQLVDCDHTCDLVKKEACDRGCNGGLMTNACKYLMQAGGLEDEKSYPYTGKQGPCKFREDKTAVRITNFTNIPIDEDQIAANLVQRGPLAVGLNAAFMQTYIGGVFCPLICLTSVNHGVLLVGYGSRGLAPLRPGDFPYWIIKNSWGKRWGESGYCRFCIRNGLCGIDTMVSVVAVAVAA